MTTPEAEEQYLAEHLAACRDKRWAVVNPNSIPEEDLPVIYGFNNGGSSCWYSAVLLAEDGTALGGHCCSHEGYMPSDLGVLEGTRPDRHETFLKHYPDGYRMEFVSYKDAKSHEKLNLAFKRNQELAEQAAKTSEPIKEN